MPCITAGLVSLRLSCKEGHVDCMLVLNQPTYLQNSEAINKNQQQSL